MVLFWRSVLAAASFAHQPPTQRDENCATEHCFEATAERQPKQASKLAPLPRSSFPSLWRRTARGRVSRYCRSIASAFSKRRAT